MLNIRLYLHWLNKYGVIMKAVRTELLALEVITAKFLPLKPPNRMLRYYMQFSSLMYYLSVGQTTSAPLWFMQNT